MDSQVPTRDLWAHVIPSTTLSMRRRGLTDLPAEAFTYSKLWTLLLDDNQIEHLGADVGVLSSLTTLDLRNNRLTSLPPEIGLLVNLRALYLQGNQLVALPPEIGQLTNLRILDLGGNQLEALPDQIGRLGRLHVLELAGNRLTRLPESIGDLADLEALDVGHNQLEGLPQSVGRLRRLRTLVLSRNAIGELPPSLGGLDSLAVLDASGNRMTSVPPTIGGLRRLASLDLGSNELATLPDSMFDLTGLTTLDLSGNLLSALPPAVGQLAMLRELHLAANRLPALPTTLAHLGELVELDLRENQLTTLPFELGVLIDRGLMPRLGGNSLQDPLPELVGRGWKALGSYLRSLEESVAQYEAKVLVVGEGNVGKTSLVASLLGTPFVSNRPTTHGIEIHSLSLAHPASGPDLTLRIWDFGGQEVYRITHQFFFSGRAIYLMVWNAREGQERNEIEGWIRRIRLRIGEAARVIIVATHADERQPEFDYPSLDRSLPGILAGHYCIDNETGRGIDALRAAMAAEVARLPHMGSQLSSRWIATRDEVLGRSANEPHIAYDEFLRIAHRQGMSEADARTLAELLHDLGHIIYYGDDDGLRDIVVLNPEWLTKAIGYVLEDEATRNNHGVLDHRRLPEIWSNRAEGITYPERFHPYFLRLMEKFDVSYRLDDIEDASLVAQLVPHERPSLPWTESTEPAAGIRTISLLCRLSEPAPGLIAWLTVRHHHASIGKHWRGGVFLRDPVAAYDSEALLQLLPDGRLRLDVRAPSPELFFNAIRDSIEFLIRRRWAGLSYQLFIPCGGRRKSENCDATFQLDGLLTYRAQGGTSYRCLNCQTDHNVAALLTGFSTPEPQPDLVRMNEQLSRVAEGVERIESLAATTAGSVRQLTKAIAAEVTDCPPLFNVERHLGAKDRAFARVAAAKVVQRWRVLSTPLHFVWQRVRFRERYRITLWCEHPGHWHPTADGSYLVGQPQAWLANVAPYAAVVLAALRLTVPVVAMVTSANLVKGQFDALNAKLEAMKSVIESVPNALLTSEFQLPDAVTITDRLTPAQGSALRGFRALLIKVDTTQRYGGLRRVSTSAGDLLWVCANHYHAYDPGLPRLPGRRSSASV